MGVIVACLVFHSSPPVPRVPSAMACLEGEHHAAPKSPADSLYKLLADRDRCSLAEAGDLLRSAGVSLPKGVSLSKYVESQPGLVLKGTPSNRQVALVHRTTESALVRGQPQIARCLRFLAACDLFRHVTAGRCILWLRCSEDWAGRSPVSNSGCGCRSGDAHSLG